MIDVIAAESLNSSIDIYRNAKTSNFDPFFSLHFPAFPHISRAVLLQRPIYPNLVDIRCHLTIVIVEQGKPHHILYSFSDQCGCCNMVTARRLIPLCEGSCHVCLFRKSTVCENYVHWWRVWYRCI